MKKLLLFTSVILGLIIMTYPKAITGFAGGSPGGKTNSPMDGQNCTACHAGSINSGQGSVTITSDIPASGYIPANTYTITVESSHPSYTKYGFELTAESFGNKTGGFTIVNSSQTKLINGGNAVTHKIGGTLGSASKTWSVNWTAPAAGNMSVDFYATSVTANGNSQNSGDNVYTANYSVNEEVSVAINNVSTDLEVTFNGSELIINGTSSLMALNVYDIKGKLISNQYEVQLPSTINTINLSAGIYIVNSLDINGIRMTNKISIY
ncbi:MAG: choice-of-anchor V domain-containing protein [Flavobacteriales bacterium]